MKIFKTSYVAVSHEEKPLTCHYTDCLIGILIMVYDNPGSPPNWVV